MRRVAAGFVFLMAGLSAAIGQQDLVVLSPAEAHAKAVAGEVVLVDIRTPGEWQETGLPASAHAITMNQDGRALLAALDRVTGGDRTRPIALICRTGNRSAHLQGALRKVGYTRVIDVSQGMIGSRHGPGWMKAGLPIRAGHPASAPLLAKSP